MAEFRGAAPVSLMNESTYEKLWIDELLEEERRAETIRDYNAVQENAKATAAYTERELSPEEAQHLEDTRHVVCSAAYLLFIIPLLLDRYDPLYRFHAKQGLKVNILEVLVIFVKPILLTIGTAMNSVLIISITSILGYLLWAAVLVLILMGVYNAWTDKANPEKSAKDAKMHTKKK